MNDNRKKMIPSELVNESVWLYDNGRHKQVSIAQIAYISSADDYAEIHLQDGQSLLSRTRLHEWEEQLSKEGFVRIHRQSLINVGTVTTIVKNNGAYLISFAGLKTLLPIARRRLREVRQKLQDCYFPAVSNLRS